MVGVAESILENRRAHETADDCMPVKELLHLIPGAF
jgi:hypothetical protein